MDWLPIESAPKDGTRVRMGHCDDAGFKRNGEGIFCPTGVWENGEWALSSWFEIPVGGHTLLAEWPTHWMPLPPPPAEQQG